MEEGRFLTFDETCERMGKTRQGIHYLATKGVLTKFERGVGKEIFFKESEVDELMKIREAA